ncbi:MAG: ABC transporter substrate-binding protein [Suipraeoptans sp.]
MHRNKKMISGIIATVLFVTILSGIAINKKSEPTVLTFGIFAQSNWGVANASVYRIYDQAIDKFEKEHPGVKIKYESGIRKDDYSEWLSGKALTGDEPDVFMILSEDFYKYAQLGLLDGLDNVIANDSNFNPNSFYGETIQMGVYKDSQYALPFETVPKLMFVNKSLLEKEGIDVPSKNWTWEDLKEIATKVTKDTNGDGVIDQFGTCNYTWQEALYSDNATIFDDDGRSASLSDRKSTEAIKFAKDISDLNQGIEVTADDFNAGNVAFMPLMFSEYRTYKTYPYKIKKYTDFRWDCTTMPAGPNGGNISEVDALLMGISSKTTNKELSWEFLKLLTQDEEIQRLNLEYSQAASVLKSVTGSQYAEDTIRENMDASDKVIEYRLLDDVMENGKSSSKFPKYEDALEIADNRINQTYKEEKNIKSSMKILELDLIKYLNN